MSMELTKTHLSFVETTFTQTQSCDPTKNNYLFQKSTKMTPSQPEAHWARLNLAVSRELLTKAPDLWLVSTEGFHLPTYASLLTLHSSLLKNLLSSSSSFYSCSSSLSVPIPALPLSLLLTLLSEGYVSHNLPFNPLEVLEAAELLRIDIDIHVANKTERTSPPTGSEDSLEGSFLEAQATAAEDSKTDLNLEGIKMEEDGTFQCKTCDYTATRKGDMKNHDKVHSFNNSFYKCPSGGCMFKTKIKSHMRIHDGAKHKGLRFDCKLCDYQTAYKKDLGKHIERKHESGTSPFSWPCGNCNFKGLDISDLKIHINKRHNKLPQTMD